MSSVEINFKSSEIEYNGPCLTCMYSGNCFKRLNSSVSMLACEDYKLYQNPDLPINLVPLSKKNILHVKNPENLHTGLCIDCERREHCKYHKPEGGVWHCEEYE